MNKIKKLISYLLVVAMTAGVTITGTVAYLTSEDSDVNVMTLGNVKIAQHEYERATNEDGTYQTDTIDDRTSYVLQNFTQGKPLLPIVGDPNEPGDSSAYAGYDSTPVRMSQVDSYGGMDVFAGKNAKDKFVTVENTGKTDAYVRTIVAIEVGSADSGLIGLSYHFTWGRNDIGTVAINDNNYMVVEFVYEGWNDGNRHNNGILPAGKTTYPNLSQVYIKHNATNEDMEAIDGNGNGTLDILVLSQAVQAAGFENAQTALDTAFGDANETNIPTWFGDAKVPEVVDKDRINDALNEGKDIVFGDDIEIPAEESNGYGKTGIKVYKGQTIDGADNTFKALQATGTWDSGITAYGGTIKNLTVGQGFRGIFISHITGDNGEKCGLVTLENVVIDGSTYTISCDQGTNNGLTATDCTFNGWTSYAATLGDVEFIDCNFGQGNGYSFMRPYAPTAFVGCDFADGYKMDPRAAVTFENCTINGVALTGDNLSTLVTSNIANATVK